MNSKPFDDEASGSFNSGYLKIGISWKSKNSPNQVQTLSNQDPQEAAPEPQMQNPPYFNQQTNAGHVNQETQMNSANFAFNGNNPFSSSFSSQNMSLHDRGNSSLSSNSLNQPIPSSFAERRMGEKSYGGLDREANTLEMQQVNRLWPEEPVAVAQPKPIEDMSIAEINNELDRLETTSSADINATHVRIRKLNERLECLVKVEDQEGQSFINPNQLLAVQTSHYAEEQKAINLILNPFETWFTTDIKDERMILTSVKSNKKVFENITSLKDVKMAKIIITHLHIEDRAIIDQLAEYFDVSNKIEEIVLEFRGLKEDAAFDDRISRQIKGIIETILTKNPSLEKIQAHWDFQAGTEVFLDAISDKFLNLIATLKRLSLFIKTKISSKSFHDFVERVQLIQKNLTVFEFEASLESPEPSSLTKLSLPKVKQFTLNLVCFGPFSDQLVTFTEQSLLSMKSLEDLDLKLIIKDFSGGDTEDQLARLLARINPNLSILTLIVCLGQENDLERFLKMVVKNLTIQTLKSIKIGIDPTDTANFVEKKNETSISEFWSKKKQEFNL